MTTMTKEEDEFSPACAPCYKAKKKCDRDGTTPCSRCVTNGHACKLRKPTNQRQAKVAKKTGTVKKQKKEASHGTGASSSSAAPAAPPQLLPRGIRKVRVASKTTTTDLLLPPPPPPLPTPSDDADRVQQPPGSPSNTTVGRASARYLIEEATLEADTSRLQQAVVRSQEINFIMGHHGHHPRVHATNAISALMLTHQEGENYSWVMPLSLPDKHDQQADHSIPSPSSAFTSYAPTHDHTSARFTQPGLLLPPVPLAFAHESPLTELHLLQWETMEKLGYGDDRHHGSSLSPPPSLLSPSYCSTSRCSSSSGTSGLSDEEMMDITDLFMDLGPLPADLCLE